MLTRAPERRRVAPCAETRVRRRRTRSRPHAHRTPRQPPNLAPISRAVGVALFAKHKRSNTVVIANTLAWRSGCGADPQTSGSAQHQTVADPWRRPGVLTRRTEEMHTSQPALACDKTSSPPKGDARLHMHSPARLRGTTPSPNRDLRARLTLRRASSHRWPSCAARPRARVGAPTDFATVESRSPRRLSDCAA